MNVYVEGKRDEKSQRRSRGKVGHLIRQTETPRDVKLRQMWQLANNFEHIVLQKECVRFLLCEAGCGRAAYLQQPASPQTDSRQVREGEEDVVHSVSVIRKVWKSHESDVAELPLPQNHLKPSHHLPSTHHPTEDAKKKRRGLSVSPILDLSLKA